MTIAEMQRQLVDAAMRYHDGNREAVARELGIGIRTLAGWLRNYGYPPRWQPKPEEVVEARGGVQPTTLKGVAWKLVETVRTLAHQDTEGRGLGKCDVCLARLTANYASDFLRRLPGDKAGDDNEFNAHFRVDVTNGVPTVESFSGHEVGDYLPRADDETIDDVAAP
jgi:hypothetical protein